MEHRHKRPVKGTGTGTSKGFIVAIAITGIIAIIAAVIVFSPLGDKLQNDMIRPMFSCSSTQQEDDVIVSALSSLDDQMAEQTASPQPTKDTRESVMLEETPFYILQMGAFLEEDAAKEHADQIKRMGGGGVLFQDGNVYRVFAAAYADEPSLVKVQGQVRSDGFEATPYITDQRAVKITFEGKTDAVNIMKTAVNMISKTPSALTDLCLLYDKSEISDAQLIVQISNMLEQCNSTIEDMTAIPDATVTTIRNLLLKYQENLSTFLREHDSMDTKTVSAELKSLQLYIIIDYIMFFDKK